MSAPQPELLTDRVVRLGTPIVNWYLVADDAGVTMVDAGLQGFLPQLVPGLRLLGCSLDDIGAVLLTHGDGDHVGVAAKMQKEGSDIPIYLHPEDAYLAEKHRKRFEDPIGPLLLKPGAWRLLGHLVRYGAVSQPKIGRTVDLTGGETLDVPGSPHVLSTPGHTEGHVSFHFPDHGALFVGDTICTWHPVTGQRRVQIAPFNVSSSDALESLSRYEHLDADLLLVGHGEPWTRSPAAAVEQARSSAPRPAA